VWHLVTYCSTLSSTIGIPRLTQRSVSDFPLGKTPQFGNLYVLLVQYLYPHHDPNSPIMLTQTLYWGRPGQLRVTAPSVIFMLHYFQKLNIFLKVT